MPGAVALGAALRGGTSAVYAVSLDRYLDQPAGRARHLADKTQPHEKKFYALSIFLAECARGAA